MIGIIKMKLRIIDTTDGKYEGEIYEADSIAPVGSVITHKGTSFKVEEIKAKGKYITFHCTNYAVTVEVLEN